MPDRPTDCVLNVRFMASEDAVTVDYRFENRSGDFAYVFNLQHRFIDAGGRYIIEPNLAVVEMHGDRVTIAKKMVPVPDDMSVERPNIPCVSEVAAGHVLNERFTLNAPLRAWTPYREAVREPDTVRSLPVSFELGFFLAPRRPPAYTVLAGSGAICPNAFDIRWQKILQAGSASVRAGIDRA